MPRAAAPSPRRLVSAAEVAEHFGVSRRHLYDLANEGRIPGWRVGSAWRFDLDEVSAALRREAIASNGGGRRKAGT